jgi:hypothetical protein
VHRAYRGLARRATIPPPFEAAEQATFVKWWAWQYPKVLLYAIPNGTFLFGDSDRRAGQMVRLKAQGLVPGMPDLHCPQWRLWMEFKRLSGGRLSKDQVLIIERLRAIGDTVLVPHGAEAAISQVREFLAKNN